MRLGSPGSLVRGLIGLIDMDIVHGDTIVILSIIQETVGKIQAKTFLSLSNDVAAFNRRADRDGRV